MTSASATHGLANFSESYQYDPATGNLVDKNGVALACPSANGSDPTHPHAAISASANGNASSYIYDDNGNQTTRNINTPNGIENYQLSYDAENRLISVTGPNLTANFTYDGDGRRVKSVINDVTTLFAGGHYEQTGNQVTKYYFAGATRIAVRTYVVSQSNTLNYLVGDQLGSTSLAVDASTGDVVTTKYKPWGEVRWTTENKTLLTRYTFTGQYSYVSDDATDLGAAGFGLMFYNARWYDPMTGRMAQADSVMPGGVQGMDRYAYAGNSPIVYSDPTGHYQRKSDYQNQIHARQLATIDYCAGDSGSGCPSQKNPNDGNCAPNDTTCLAKQLELTYGVNIDGNFSAIQLEAMGIGLGKLMSAMGAEAFGKLFGGVTFYLGQNASGTKCQYANDMCTGGQRDVIIGNGVGDDLSYIAHETVHEFAHIWDNSCNDCMSIGMMYKTGGAYSGGDYKAGGTPPTNYAATNGRREDWAESLTEDLYPGYTNGDPRDAGYLDGGRTTFVSGALENPFLNPLIPLSGR